MTKDFTKIGRVSATREQQAATANDLEKSQVIVLVVIKLTAITLLFAGLWLVMGNPSPIPQESSFIVGMALIISGIFDWVSVKFIRRAWTRNKLGSNKNMG